MAKIDFYTDPLQLMTGVNIPVEGLGITIRQPTIQEISMLGEQRYFMALQLVTMTKDHIALKTPEVTNWLIFQETLKQKITGVNNVQQLCLNFLQLFFIRQVQMGPRSLMLIGENGVQNIEGEDFDALQVIIKEIGGAGLVGGAKQEEFNPKNKKAAEIAAKMKKARERLNKVKAIENGITGEQKGFLASYMKAACVATPNGLEEVKKMTLYQLNTIIQTYFAKEAYDLDISSRLAGAKNEKPLVHWLMSGDQKDDGIGII